MPSPRRLMGAFLGGSLLVLAVLPAINLSLDRGARPSDRSLFDIEFALPAVDALLVRAGISTLPNQVIVGKGGWFFLGDQFAHGISAKRIAAGAEEIAAARRAAMATQAWRSWFEAHGVRSWHVLVCADKDSIYPDQVPDWDRFASGSAIDARIQAEDPRIVTDSRPDLRQARSVAGPALYLHTDSHWTPRGAWVAYRTLAKASAADLLPMTWLQDADVQLLAIDQPTGDLARMLRVSADSGDQGVRAVIAGGREEQRNAVHAENGGAVDAAVLRSVEAPRWPVLVRSPRALNAHRLLLLRDSFGTALLPYLTATYGEVVEIDRASLTPTALARLVASVKPDAVLAEVVERNARDPWFEALPPASTR